MSLDQFLCDHACRNTCASLREAMHAETELMKFYDRIGSECDYPDIHKFLGEMAEERRVSILRIVQKLNEMTARGQILDGISSSFDDGVRK